MYRNITKLQNFYDAMPDDLTLDEFAAGIEVWFQFEGVTYKVNTQTNYSFATRATETYRESLELKVNATEPAE